MCLMALKAPPHPERSRSEQSKDARSAIQPDASGFAPPSGEPRDALGEQAKEPLPVHRLQYPRVDRPAGSAAPIDDGHADRQRTLRLDRDIRLAALEQLG